MANPRKRGVPTGCWMNTGGEPRRVLNGKRVNGSTCTPMSSLATGLSAVLGCVSVWRRSDRLGPGAQGTCACLCHGHSMDHAWSVAGDRSCPEPAEQAGETSLPAGAVPADARAPVQATLCCPLPARWPPPPGPPAYGRGAEQTQLPLPPPPWEASGPPGWAHGALSWRTARGPSGPTAGWGATGLSF